MRRSLTDSLDGTPPALISAVGDAPARDARSERDIAMHFGGEVALKRQEVAHYTTAHRRHHGDIKARWADLREEARGDCHDG